MKPQGMDAEYKRKEIKSKKKKKTEKFLFFLEFIFLSGMLSVILILLALSPLFEVKSIAVNGSERYSEEDIIIASGLRTGINGFKAIGSSLDDILSFRYGAAEDAVKKDHPYIKDIVVKYVLPDKIEMSIQERVPFAVVPFYGTYLLVDNEACVLETFNGENTKSLPLIKGLKFEGYKLGQALEFEVEENFLLAVDLINQLSKSDEKSEFKLLPQVDYFDVKDAENICLFYDSRIIVNLGDLRELGYRIDFMKEILQKNIRKDEKGRLDFTLSKNPSFIPNN